MKNFLDIKTICEEYSEECEIKGEDVVCLVHQKYFEDLEKRVLCHGWVIKKAKKKHFLIYIEFFNPFL